MPRWYRFAYSQCLHQHPDQHEKKTYRGLSGKGRWSREIKLTQRTQLVLTNFPFSRSRTWHKNSYLSFQAAQMLDGTILIVIGDLCQKRYWSGQVIVYVATFQHILFALSCYMGYLVDFNCCLYLSFPKAWTTPCSAIIRWAFELQKLGNSIIPFLTSPICMWENGSWISLFWPPMGSLLQGEPGLPLGTLSRRSPAPRTPTLSWPKESPPHGKILPI